MFFSAKRSSVNLSQQTPPLVISAPLMESEMSEQQLWEEAKNSGVQSGSDDKNDPVDDESKR